MSGTVWIYGLQDPRTRRFRYVGMTTSPRSRARWHRHNVVSRAVSRGSEAFRCWASELRELDIEPLMVVLDEVAHEDTQTRRKAALDAENTWTARLFTQGYALLNQQVCDIDSYCPLGEMMSRIAAERGVCGVTYMTRQLAERSGYSMSKQGLSFYLRGDRKPSKDFNVAFADAFELDASERAEYAALFTYGTAIDAHAPR